MKLVVALGNPGKQYETTRHNLGWLVMDALAKQGHVGWSKFHKAEALACKWTPAIVLAKPQTFMNKSGLAVAAMMAFYKMTPEDLIVVHDELDLPFGQLRISKDASAGGHNGIKSIIEAIGSQDFVRLRLGIKTDRRDKVPADAFVLERFGLLERLKLKSAMAHYLQALECLLDEDATVCMNKFNA